jgi:hypothetical protein
VLLNRAVYAAVTLWLRLSRFPESLQSNDGVSASIKPRRLPSASFPIHYSPSSHHSMLCILSQIKYTQIFILKLIMTLLSNLLFELVILSSCFVLPTYHLRWIYLCNRPWRLIGLWDVEAPTAPAVHLPPGTFLVLTSVGGRVDPRAIVRQEELDQFKIKSLSWESNPQPPSL